MKFIDLFAGLGGFHVGLSRLGHTCVYASELVPELRDLYFYNYGVRANGDIKIINEANIPQHDILCAGFPCQPFSKAGNQVGLGDADRGTLFYDIARILKYHKPNYFILENVPNLKNHDSGNTWTTISRVLTDDLGYYIATEKLSPHEFGIPQIRERLFIVGSLQPLSNFQWPTKVHKENMHIGEILDDCVAETEKKISNRELEALTLWQELIERLPGSVKLPSFPIWAMEFGASYPVDGKSPFHLTRKELDMYTGSFGLPLYGLKKKEQLEKIPNYAQAKQVNKRFPAWKSRFILQNRIFYNKNKQFIDPVLDRIRNLPNSWQKLEWNCQGEERNIFENIIQFRGSGIRVKRPNYSPALVSSSSTQRPIIGWEKRYLTVKEASKLQSLGDITLMESEVAAFRALGNAVNAKVVELIADRLIGTSSIREDIFMDDIILINV